MDTKTTNDLLALLQRELSLVRCYREALPKIDNSHVRAVLEECQSSHQNRIDRLYTAIDKSTAAHANDMPPDDELGPEGKFAELLTEGAATIGEKAVLAALDEAEDLLSNNYEWRLVNMHNHHRDLVKEELLPQQQMTRNKISELTNKSLKGLWPPTPDAREV